jgi:hypothetical protein
MKTLTHRKLRRFELQIMAYGNRYYIERVAKLETVLARRPRVLQIDLIGVGEILADFALIFRSALMKRSPRTRIVTNACSSLQGGSVLVWLMSETRIICEDAKVFFRKANLPEEDGETNCKGRLAFQSFKFAGQQPSRVARMVLRIGRLCAVRIRTLAENQLHGMETGRNPHHGPRQ